MLKLKFRCRNHSLIIEPQPNKKTAGYTRKRISILPKKIISIARRFQLLTAVSQAMGESEVTHECCAFAANAGGVDPLSAQSLR
jgi:hypothetical protein